MTFSDWLTIFLFAGILTAVAIPLGRYVAAVYTGQRTFADRVLGGPERHATSLNWRFRRGQHATGGGSPGPPNRAFRDFGTSANMPVRQQRQVSTKAVTGAGCDCSTPEGLRRRG
jgi:hypothetical protein